MAPLQLLAPFLLLALAAVAVSGLYLPLTNVTVAVPRDVKPPVSLLNFHALDADDEIVKFRLLGVYNWLRLDSESGELTIVAKVPYADLPSTATVVAEINDPGFGSVSSANTTVRFVATNTTACEMNSQDMCFWSDARYQILENQKETNLGPIGPPAFCQYRKPQYKLKSDSLVYLEGSEERSSIVSRDGLDRDREHSPALLVACSLGNTHATYSLSVLDEDDNLPEPNDELHAVFNSSGKLVEGQALGFIMLKDLDSLDVNEYKWEILGDSLQLLRANCRAMSIHHTIEDMTYLRCDILAAKTTQLPMNRYSALLRINDTRITSTNNSNYIDVNVELQKPVPTPPSAAHVDLSRLHVVYPSEVSILRGAAPLTRVAQPSVNMSTLMLPHAPRFSLVKNHFFNITAVGGIIYVAKDNKKPDQNVLQFAPSVVSITVQWNNSSSKISVIVVNGTSKACESRSGQWPRCSKYTNPKECNQACGWGTGGKHSSVNNIHVVGADNFTEEVNEHGGCVWRGDRYGKSNGLTIKYATCVPSIDTCPDQLCDPLEDAKQELCPQDCYNKTMGIMGSSKGQTRGMYSGHGVCRCEKKNCYCSDVIATPNNRSPSSKTTTRHVEGTTEETPPASSPSVVINSRAECGQDCVMVVAAACVLVVSATLGFAYWRYRPAGKLRRDRKLVDHGGVGSLAAVQSDYVDRTTDTLTTSAEFRTTPDPKWEFPRSRLIIDRTLGEGEFGRVMRARAIDINGIKGSTTVAVKTLKEGASSAELADLLSEYQLLKEVNHPNVIRLLGACTTPGAPVYIIIEFAEHGSLRNYLRKSRHLEPSSVPTGPTKPRDILSFAWQICKGMTYLSEIKLVHRDLAARNVLVAAGGVCKVSDFGLTRDVYEDDAYLKRSKGRVPVKWMALESLADHVYTSKSDVWSFGVLLWELVTLGASPYPGVAVHNLFHLLRAGYRMERPENCSPALYRVMRNCWMDDPTDRPSFKKLTEVFEQMLEDGVEYLDLNPRIVQNKAYFSSLSGSGDDLDESDLGYGNINILPTDSVNYLLPTQRSTFIQSQQTWQIKMPEEKQQLLTEQDEKSQGTPLQSSAINMYLSPIHVQSHSSTYMNMAGSSVPDLTASQRNTNLQLSNERSTHSSPCTSLLTQL